MINHTRRWAEVLLVLCMVTGATAQDVRVNWHPLDGAAYQSEELPEVHVTCDQMGWILQQENWYSNIEHSATFVFFSSLGTDTVENVGFRLRGNTSRGAPKNPTRFHSTHSTMTSLGKA